MSVSPSERGSPQFEGDIAPNPWPRSDDLPLRICHRDDDLIVIDKPPGLLVHRTALDAHEQDTVMSRLWRELGASAPAGLTPVHRLDKGTSGLLVLACHPAAARHLGRSLEQGLATKRYLALVRGWPVELAFEVDHPLARDPERPSAGQMLLAARTRFERLARVEWPFSADGRHAHSRYALLQAEPAQGRRHQIRRHLKHAAHPIVGDATHGKGAHNRAVAQWLGLARLWLHAWTLQLPHPDGCRWLTLRAPPGPDWARLQGYGPWQDALAPLDTLPGPAAPAHARPPPGGMTRLGEA